MGSVMRDLGTRKKECVDCAWGEKKRGCGNRAHIKGGNGHDMRSV